MRRLIRDEMIQERGKGGAEDAFMDWGEKKENTPPDVLMGSLSSRAGLEPAPYGTLNFTVKAPCI